MHIGSLKFSPPKFNLTDGKENIGSLIIDTHLTVKYVSTQPLHYSQNLTQGQLKWSKARLNFKFCCFQAGCLTQDE